MLTRRAFLRGAGAAGTFTLASLRVDALERVASAAAAVGAQTPAEIARDEFFWREIQQAFTLDRTIVNLNNGGVCPSPRVVHEALKRYLDISNQAPVYHMWQILEPNIESVRRGLARELGCDPEELAITRNASEALQIAQLGIDLQPGDEVLTTNQDYGRMLNTWRQRVRRDAIKLNEIAFPVPPPSMADLAQRLEQAITPRTKIIHFCHITNLTGQIFPMKEICAMARARGIKTIVDGAHAFAHFPFKANELECDYYGCSLHKWLTAPIGTGFLYVRRDLIPSTWPLQPAPKSMENNIRKFEEIGTHPASVHNAIAEALTFLHGIGLERKAARLHYLKTRWANRVASLPGVRLHTSLDPTQSCGLANVGLDAVDCVKLTEFFWTKHRIIVTPIKRDDYQGIRVTPNVYTTLEEIDTFAGILEDVARRGTV